jgi:aryl-alcohol dehydrogenase-like predicted oxidoreductase
METRRLGRLGHMSSVLIYGGAALSDVAESVADRSIELALDAGVNHFDTAPAYGDSELHLGRRMDTLRDRIFLATKTGERDAGAAYDSIRRSLERLRTERVDLIQLHAVCDLDDLNRATGPDGALAGATKAKDEGLVGAIGITGHGMQAPAVHLEALRRFDFDTIITPYNFKLAQYEPYRRQFDALADVTASRDVGLMVIKALARNLWRAGEKSRQTTWYEPFEDQAEIGAAVAFVLARAEVTGICAAGDVGLLPMMIEAERGTDSRTTDDIESVLGSVPDYESPFVRVEGRSVPDWLQPLVSKEAHGGRREA